MAYKGERNRDFQRLQKEVMKIVDYYTVDSPKFTPIASPLSVATLGILPTSPYDFEILEDWSTRLEAIINHLDIQCIA